MKTDICIASDSLLICNTLERAFSATFSKVQVFNTIQEAIGSAANPNTIVLLEISDIEDFHKLIDEAIDTKINLNQIILLLRTENQLDEVASLIGTVGAILPPTVALESIVQLSQMLCDEICIIPVQLAPTKRLASNRGSMQNRNLRTLSDRERTVLSHLSVGDCDKEIAATLAISDSTVRFHIRSIMRKLGTQNRIQTALKVYD